MAGGVVVYLGSENYWMLLGEYFRVKPLYLWVWAVRPSETI